MALEFKVLFILANGMKNYTAVVEKCADTGYYVGYVPGFPGCHSQGLTLDELKQSLEEVLSILLENGEPQLLLRQIAKDIGLTAEQLLEHY